MSPTDGEVFLRSSDGLVAYIGRMTELPTFDWVAAHRKGAR